MDPQRKAHPWRDGLKFCEQLNTSLAEDEVEEMFERAVAELGPEDIDD